MTGDNAIVIGSGPSGFATAAHLLRRGWRVRMLDFGTLSERIADHHIPVNQTNDNRERLINVQELKWSKGCDRGESLNPKRLHGDYFFSGTDKYLIRDCTNAAINASFAQGGLSNVWGGNVLPPDDDDIQDWPVGADKLRPYYNTVAELMPVSADSRDALSDRFKFPVGRRAGFTMGPQARDMLSRMAPHRETLERAGVYFGQAKLAIDPDVAVDANKDPYPYGPIFNSAVGLQKLKQDPRFEYVGGVMVRRVRENGARSVTAEGFRAADNSRCEFAAEKVFVACGVLGTAQLLARSFGLRGRVIRVRTNQNAFFPFLRFQRTRGVSRQRSNSISQIFIDICNEHTGGRFCHIEVHQFGDYVMAPINAVCGRLAPLVVVAGRPILERVVVMQAFLHSDFSDILEVTFHESDDWRADVTGLQSPVMRDAYTELLGFLRKNCNYFGGWPVSQIMMVDPPGASNHLGGSFPMRRRSRDRLSSDVLGRPLGCRNIHITDASVLPSLPATTLTFSVMANAARIADEVARGRTAL